MMGCQFFQPSSWPFYDIIKSSADNVQVGEYHGLMDMVDDAYVDVYEFLSFTAPEDSYDISSIPCFSSVCPSPEFAQSSASVDDHYQSTTLSVEDFLLDTEGLTFDQNVNGDMEFVCGRLSSDNSEMSNEGKEGWSPSPSIKSNESFMALTLPGEEMELENQLSILHLLKAYGEAMENGQSDLADVTMRCVSEKVSLAAGEPLSRLAFNLSSLQHHDHGDYLKQESSKNFEAAFNAFYQLFPYGRIAHFAANAAILEAIPADAEMIHIVDLDMGEGVQWPPMLEALARLHKAVNLTAIKWEKQDSDKAPLLWNFEEAKRRLVDHSKRLGLKLKIEEMGIEDLVSEIKRSKKRGGRNEWLAFNCMVGLPHMGRVRSRKVVEEFLRLAKGLMGSNGGIITFGDGDSWETLKNCSSFASFFEGKIAHYLALLESIESNFPVHLAEARMALECLFAAPFISSHGWLHKWMEMKEGCNLEMGSSLEGWRISEESLEEGREIVKGKQSFYGVRVGGQWNNEMILEWKGTALLRISAWRN